MQLPRLHTKQTTQKNDINFKLLTVILKLFLKLECSQIASLFCLLVGTQALRHKTETRASVSTAMQPDVMDDGDEAFKDTRPGAQSGRISRGTDEISGGVKALVLKVRPAESFLAARNDIHNYVSYKKSKINKNKKTFFFIIISILI